MRIKPGFIVLVAFIAGVLFGTWATLRAERGNELMSIQRGGQL